MQGMYSATTHDHRLLLGVLSALLLLHSAHCLSAGEQCGGAGASGECADGLACVAVSIDSPIAFCEALDECAIFGCNVESDECVCRTETNCLASFSFASQDECQSSLKDTNRQPCELVTCPDVWCNDNLWYIPEGQCCPVCPPLPVAIFPPAISNPAGCTEDDGVHHSEGETWKRDPCVTCTCEAGLALCSSVSCLPLACANPIQLPDHCCPMCPPQAMSPSIVFFEPAPTSSVCREGDMTYKDGESWVPDKTNPCKRGYCDEGEIFYLYRQCLAPECENPIYSEDTCCPRCPGEEKPKPIRNVRQAVFSSSSPNHDIAPRSVPEDAVPTSRSDAIDDGDLGNHVVSPTTSIPAPTSAPTCYDNGMSYSEGESWCPIPEIVAVCHSGTFMFTRHCEAPSCSNQIRGRPGTCDCPYCPGEGRQFQIVVILKMTLHQYGIRASEVRDMVDGLMTDSGLTVVNITPSEYSEEEMRFVVDVHTSSIDATEEDVLGAVLAEMENKSHGGMIVGHLIDFPMSSAHIAGRKRSIRSADAASSTNSASFSSSNSIHSSTSTAIAVSASVFGVVASVIGIALLTTYIRRKAIAPKTINV